jgi:hypothetical protein
MSKITVFIQVHGRPGILETELSPEATLGDVQDALAAAGVAVGPETFIFVEEAMEPVPDDCLAPIGHIKHGDRLQASRWKRIKTTVHYLEKTAEHEFPPGARVRTVKEWAVDKFHVSPTDAAEHVLQLCGTKDRPVSDTRLHELVPHHHEHHHHEHACLCFDFVPDKRVEG